MEPANQLDYVVYGKIIIDNVHLANGDVVADVIGGGGPQALFGAGLWSASTGLLSRSGTDIRPENIADLERLGLDLEGWVRFPHHATMKSSLRYDDNEYAVSPLGERSKMVVTRAAWQALLDEVLTLPPSYQRPRVVHLVTEDAVEPMVESALALPAAGSTFSLEPIIDYREWSNREAIVELLKSVDVVAPDWPSASGMAESDDPYTVIKYWSTLGPSLVAVRHGANGSYVWDNVSDRYWHVPPAPVDLVDPTGGGNSYSAGFCVGWDQTGDARMAACHGAVSAAYLVERVGLPDLDDNLRAAARKRLSEVESIIQPLGPSS